MNTHHAMLSRSGQKFHSLLNATIMGIKRTTTKHLEMTVVTTLYLNRKLVYYESGLEVQLLMNDVWVFLILFC